MGFCKIAGQENMTLPIAFLGDIFCWPGSPIRGRLVTDFTMEAGVVDMRPLYLLRSPLTRALAEALQNYPRLPLLDLLLAVHDGGQKVWPVFRQLIWLVGATIESASLVSQSSQSANQQTSSHAKSPLNNRVTFRDVGFKERAERNARVAVARYFLSVRESFFEGRELNLAVDATRVGGRAVFIGFMTAPSNKGAWMPPLVLGVHKGGSGYR